MPTFLTDTLCRCGHSRQQHVRAFYCLATIRTVERGPGGITTTSPCPCGTFYSAEAAGRETVEARAEELRAEGLR